ncbi:MAG TPA: hypothetical protein PK788_00965 [Gemmatimonadaceae bacterium]|nr:hypothetical protein [Gemmatimonadaceae bacterium]HRQ77029.1 hypothetical protein [Gemmatimonadaceae bacterium]
MRRILLATAAALALGACNSTGGAPRTTPDRARGAAAARDSMAGPWTLRNLGRPRTQLVTLSAVLRSRIDTLVREDTLASQALLEWSAVPDAALARFVGMVRAFAVIVGSDSTWRPLADPPMPVSFVATQADADAQPSFVMPPDTACDGRAAVVQAMRETWMQPPQRLGVGTQWQDSSTYALCRDRIVLQARNVRRYVVEAADVRDGRLVLRVRREATTALHGSGLQFGDSIVVTGEGEATASLDVSLDGAAIVAGSGVSELRLELRGRRRTQHLVQHGALVIRTP